MAILVETQHRSEIVNTDVTIVPIEIQVVKILLYLHTELEDWMRRYEKYEILTSQGAADQFVTSILRRQPQHTGEVQNIRMYLEERMRMYPTESADERYQIVVEQMCFVFDQKGFVYSTNIARVLMNCYPQIENWARTAGCFVEITTIERHAAKFLEQLGQQQPELGTVVEVIFQKLYKRRQMDRNEDKETRCREVTNQMGPTIAKFSSKPDVVGK